jgi:hypothetical protein
MYNFVLKEKRRNKQKIKEQNQKRKGERKRIDTLIISN